MQTTQRSQQPGESDLNKDNDGNGNKAASIASSYPFELVELVLLHLSVPDLLIAAANLPKFWREVIPNSKEIWKRIARYPINEPKTPTKKSIQLGACATFLADNDHPWMFKYLFSKGMLYVVRRCDGVEGFIFAPFSEKLTLRVADPATKIATYGLNMRHGYGFIDLFDLDGRMICSKLVTDNWKDTLQKYLSTFYGDEAAVVDALYKVRKARTEKMDVNRERNAKKRQRPASEDDEVPMAKRIEVGLGL